MVRVTGFEPTASWSRLSADSPLRVKVSEIGGIAPFSRTPTVRYIRLRPSCNGSVNGSPLISVHEIPISRRQFFRNLRLNIVNGRYRIKLKFPGVLSPKTAPPTYM